MGKKMKNTKDTMTKNARKRVQLICDDPSLTKQYFKDDCDINNIVNRFTETGQIPLQNRVEPQYGFAPNIDLKTALDLTKNLHQEFDELSDEKKSIFGNNPENYAQFLSDYAESPESFSIEPELDTDTLHQDTDKNAKKTASAKPDEVSKDET